MSILKQPFALFGAIAASFGNTRRYENLFSLSDPELQKRGYDREKLVRCYITGLARS